MPAMSISVSHSRLGGDSMNTKLKLTKQKIKELEQKIKEFKTSKEFFEFVKTMSKFHNYSFYNQVMIFLQKPDATKVAGFVTWKKLVRYVKRGESGIAIWVPIIYACKNQDKDDDELEEDENEEENKEQLVGFKTGYVFDISQTEGKSLPDISLDVKNEGDNFYNTCLKLAEKYSIEVNEVAKLRCFGLSKGGEIILKSEKNKTKMATTLIHEIAHEIVHKKKKSDRETMELEAETIAYIVCSHFGIQVPSYKYLAAWQKKRKIMDSLKRISHYSHLLIEDLERLRK